jgi:pimeloyl-ACP methyl ester carboxylesterase
MMRLRRVAHAGAIALFAALSSGCLEFHPGALPGAPAQSKEPGGDRYADVRGVRVHYVDVGDGPPVVLIHGFASSIGTFKGVIDALKKEHRVIALDLKGFGWTSRPEGDYSPAEQARIVAGLMDKLAVERADVVAHSWGSSVALQLALAKPDRVGKIALYDAWVYEAQLPTLFVWARADGLGEALFGMFYAERSDDKMATAFFDKKNVTEKRVELVEEELARPGTTAAALAAVRGQRYAEVEKRYGTIDKPVLLLWGREDKITTLAMGERLSKELPRARLVVFPQCGHFPMYEAKLPSTRELVAFLAPDPNGGAKAAPPPAARDEKSEPPSPEKAPMKETPF